MLNNVSLNELGVLVLLLGFGGLFLKRLLADRRSPISNIPGPSPKSWLNGNLEQLFDPVAGWDFHESLMKRYGNTALVHGSFGQKILYTYDPKAMHSVLLQQNLTTQSPVDKPIFEESDGFIQSQLLIFGNGLLGTIGHQHRKQRKMLNPMFSLTHLREMVPVLFEIAHKMENALKTQSRNSSLPDKEINILSWLGRASLEMIGEAGLGYSFDPMMDESSSHPFSRIMKDLLPTIQRMLFLRDLLPVLVRLGTPKLRRWVVGLFPWKDLHEVRDMIDYMHSVASDIYNSKKRPLEQNINMPQRLLGTGKDLISILMKENERAATDQKLDKEEVISLIVTFIFSAMDTTSSAMARTLHLLAKHPDIQETLRQELRTAADEAEDADIPYETLISLPYLDAVCRETLRLHPPVPFTMRVAQQDTVISLSKPVTGRDGSRMQEIPITRGTHIFIPITTSNTNPDLWLEDAREWKPERWLSPLPETLLSARVPGVYSHLMTFIAGNRACIGFTMAQLEMKVVLSVLIQSLSFAPALRDSEIFWQMNTVVAPVVGKNPHPELPLIVTPVCADTG